MNLSDIPVLDNHCHFFSTTYDRKPLHRGLSLSLNAMPDDQLRHSLLYQNLLMGLSELLKSGTDEEMVLGARERAAAEDYKGWVERLFSEVDLRWLLVDIGLAKSEVGFTDFETLVPAKVRYVYRLESVVDDLWKDRVSAAEGRAEVRRKITEAASRLDIVAVKSIIGYRTGLEINPDLTVRETDGSGEASYRGLMFLEAADLCRELKIPFHVHAAFGESNLDLRTNNPLHLKPFLDSPAGRDVNLVLIHGGYPYTFEAGYLGAMYPNVYVDISEFIPFVPLGMRRGIEDIMSMCPLNKILYGSDGFDQPESHWYGAKMAKEILGEVIQGLVDRRKISPSYAEQASHGILYKNSLGLHGLQ